MGRTLVSLCFVASLACGPAGVPKLTPDTVLLSKASHQVLTAAAARSESLKRELEVVRAELRTLRGQVVTLMKRAGLIRSGSQSIKKMRGNPTVKLGDAIRVDARLAKGKRYALKNLLKAYDGLVISFWATWCVPCISDEELKHLRELRNQLNRHGFGLVSVAVDDLNKVIQHPKAAKWLYPLYFQKDAHIEMVSKQFVQEHGMGLPLFLMVSKTGKIHMFRNNKLDNDAVDEIINAMLGMPRG